MQCVPAATRSWAASHGLLLARRGGALAISPSLRQQPHLLAFLLFNDRKPRPYPRLFASIPESYSSSSGGGGSSGGSGAAGSSEELVTIGPRMPAELEPRPKPTTAHDSVALSDDRSEPDFLRSRNCNVSILILLVQFKKKEENLCMFMQLMRSLDQASSN